MKEWEFIRSLSTSLEFISNAPLGVIRVPETEKSGRIHSSTASVVVLPDKAPVSYIQPDFKIDEKDLKIETMRARGAGGQHVNKTDSAVRITHIPTGIAASSQNSRSQHQNRESAMEVMTARVYAGVKEKADQSKQSDRRSQIGSGDRSEKIRTYNFPQARITDHRTNLTLHNIEDMMAGLLLDQFIEAAEKFNHEQMIQDILQSK